ncbi:aminotransferase class I/II-fold pyridoxal phosphate-dependent enzyme [Candidatus Avelusimicrobium facis]|uniref:aminotransferase-like domain-containing protein n=1 Tax=Candidatus Avelusimicrobium facis TaxID=3416203 RepID=UPI0015B67482
MDYKQLYSKTATGLKASAIRELLKVIARPEIISFAGGLPDPDLFPSDEVARIMYDVVKTSPKESLQYGTTEGQKCLKDELIKLLKETEEIDVQSENLLVVSASQQALDMTARVFLNRGDAIITASPTYLGALQAFEASGADVFGAESDDYGVTVAGIEKRLRQLQAAGRVCKFIYLVPDFQNPTGTTIPQERRVEILKLAEKYGTLIVEDSPYRQVRFEGQAPQTFYRLDQGRGNVLTLFTFSKVFVPGFRLGFVVGPAEIIHKFVILKQAMDLCTAPVLQLATAAYLKGGHLLRHVEAVVNVYRKKRDFMLQMLAKYMPQCVKWTRPEGGLFLWVTLPEHIDTQAMLKTALEQQVAYVAGVDFYPPRDARRNDFRMNFSYSSFEQIEEGIKRLAKTIEKYLA